MLHHRSFQKKICRIPFSSPLKKWGRHLACRIHRAQGACGRVLDATVSTGWFGPDVALDTQPQAPPRTGFTLVELIVTMVLLGVVMVTVVPLMGLVNKQRQAADARLFAVQETANILERFTIRDWDALTQESADGIELSDQTAQWLKEPSLTVTVQEIDSEPPSRRITVKLSWNNRAGDRVRPARLTSFVYRKSKSE